MTQHFSKQLLLLLGAIALTTIFLSIGKPVATLDAQYEPQPPLQTDSTVNSCRYGASYVGPHSNFVYNMRVGWTVDFGARPGSALADVEYMPTVRIGQDRTPVTAERLDSYFLKSPASMAELAALAQAYRGLVWQIGNEVDRVAVQDDVAPKLYARAYHDIYQVIKANDPTAQVAPSGLVEVTPARLQYLDIVWDEYYRLYKHPMPVDVWNMHVYILPEAEYNSAGRLVHSRAGIAVGTDPALAILYSDADPGRCALGNVYCVAEHDDISIFIQQVYAMRQWMKEHGQEHKPLILSEFSTLYPYMEATDTGSPPTCPGCYTQYDEFSRPFDRQRVTNFMNATLNFLETATDPVLGYPEDNYRLVQQWNWFAVNDSSISSSNNLVEDNGSALTLMGQTYKARNAALGFAVNLRLSEARGAAVKSTGGTATAELSATFRNNGNTRTTTPFLVTFYSNAAMTNKIGEVTIPAGVMGCATWPYTASVTWSGLTPGIHRYWVKIDNASSIVESNETDNTGSSFVLVDPHQVFLPKQ